MFESFGPLLAPEPPKGDVLVADWADDPNPNIDAPLAVPGGVGEADANEKEGFEESGASLGAVLEVCSKANGLDEPVPKRGLAASTDAPLGVGAGDVDVGPNANIDFAASPPPLELEALGAPKPVKFPKGEGLGCSGAFAVDGPNTNGELLDGSLTFAGGARPMLGAPVAADASALAGVANENDTGVGATEESADFAVALKPKGEGVTATDASAGFAGAKENDEALGATAGFSGAAGVNEDGAAVEGSAGCEGAANPDEPIPDLSTPLPLSRAPNDDAVSGVAVVGLPNREAAVWMVTGVVPVAPD